ncbi:glutaredoxin family protein [Arenimonas caeni]|uniref:NrdH-redoxin n=1 Tax=Arenimonas caeni TaxID=2058085 RepID=A0A2P6M8F5_9GAMM|nr:glutaredoxin family protein [Arenimonas caeni]PRH82264.1 NrdH-redoxin [Arenimonas caeni]
MRSALAVRTATLLLIFLLAALSASLHAQDNAPDSAQRAPDIEVYVREGCPHCANAKQFLAELQRERPELVVRRHQVDRDAEASERLLALSDRAGVWPPGVPTFVIGDEVVVGFDDAAHTGQRLRTLLDGAANRDNEVDAGWLGTLNIENIGLPLFTIGLGLVDGFNPCAMWVLLFLLSLLVRLRNRRRMALIAGTFVIVSGAVYYAFMAAWLNIFLAVGFSESVRLLLAAVALVIAVINLKDFVAFGRGLSLSIPAAAKPGIYARARRVIQAPSLAMSMIAVAVLAVLVNFVELLCTAGLPAIYTAVLSEQAVSPAAHYGYIGLYIAAYVIDDALMVGIAVVALSSGKMGELSGRALKMISGLVMLALSLILLLRPDWIL